MDLPIKGIPTTYNGTRFRSRLEARWAAFFDLAGWQWEYEPFDLSGWIPDFGLIGHDGRMILVEVKPTVLCDQAVKEKSLSAIGNADLDFMFCGVSPSVDKTGGPFEFVQMPTWTTWDRANSIPQRPHMLFNRGLWIIDNTGHFDIVPGGPPYRFHFDGREADMELGDPFSVWSLGSTQSVIQKAWRQAANTVQWKAR